MEPIERELAEFKVFVERELAEVKGCYKELDGRQDATDREVVMIKGDIKSTNQRVDGLETTLKEINDNTKWIKRAFIKGGISIGVSLAIALLIGLITFWVNSLGG